MGKTYKWDIVSETVRGASHDKTGLPNQDAVFRGISEKKIPPAVLAVSDGHGSDKCFRSAIGSQLAVQIAVKIAYKFIFEMQNENPSVIKNAAEHLLTADIVKTWKAMVDEDIQKNEFTPEERLLLSNSNNNYLAYGATLLLVAISDNFIVYLQLGDGDILVLDDSREVMRPIPDDQTLIANETTSLCMSTAQKKFRYRFQNLQEKSTPPTLILVSTDGYSNSFASIEDFNKVGADILKIIETSETKDLSYIKDNLPQWLNNSSKNGSGDDITLGIICRNDIIGRLKIKDAIRLSKWFGIKD